MRLLTHLWVCEVLCWTVIFPSIFPHCGWSLVVQPDKKLQTAFLNVPSYACFFLQHFKLYTVCFHATASMVWVFSFLPTGKVINSNLLSTLANCCKWLVDVVVPQMVTSLKHLGWSTPPPPPQTHTPCCISIYSLDLWNEYESKGKSLQALGPWLIACESQLLARWINVVDSKPGSLIYFYNTVFYLNI